MPEEQKYVSAGAIRVPESVLARLDALVAAWKPGAAVPTRAFARREALERGLASLEADLVPPGSPDATPHPVRPEAAGKLGRRPTDGGEPMVRQESFLVPVAVARRLDAVSRRIQERWPGVRTSRSAVEREATLRGIASLERGEGR